MSETHRQACNYDQLGAFAQRIFELLEFLAPARADINRKITGATLVCPLPHTP